MLTHIKTPRILIADIFVPEVYDYDHGRGNTGQSVNHRLLIQIAPETEADLPAYIRERVEDFSWYGVPKGTRGLRVASGKTPPVVFGISPDDVLKAQAHNISLDQLVRTQTATVCISRGVSKKRRADDSDWPILRAVWIGSLNWPGHYTDYTAAMEAYWEFQE